jgi:hypothetical protein
MQLPLKQHPLLHVFPAQQGEPGEPHTAHRPVDDVELHTVPSVQRSAPPVPGQQVWPASPHTEHTPLLQDSPAWQVVPQHGCPDPPQPVHLPAVHTPGLVPVLPPVPTVVVPQACASATHSSL